MVPGVAFLSHFVICLAVAAAAFFAWQNGVPQQIWATDLSHVTNGIAALFVFGAVYLGWQAWKLDEIAGRLAYQEARAQAIAAQVDVAFGHMLEMLFPALGMLGTVAGLSMQAKNLVSGPASFLALSTGLYSTGCGIVAMVLTMLFVFNLGAGIRRAGR
jgi:hypothetical protein